MKVNTWFHWSSRSLELNEFTKKGCGDGDVPQPEEWEHYRKGYKQIIQLMSKDVRNKVVAKALYSNSKVATARRATIGTAIAQESGLLKNPDV